LQYHRISRDDTTLASDFHFFTSHFYTTLAAGGPKAVESWTRRKKINVFEKKLIFVPINKDLHWSLCVIVNPGAIVSSLEGTPSKNDSLCCLIFLDSLRMHNKNTVCSKIRSWLNNEWQRVNSECHELVPFKLDSLRLFSPKGECI
jgi:Ulp1 family protease